MIPEPDDNRLDESLRSKFEQFAPPPSGRVWPGIAPHVGPPPLPRPRRRSLPLPLLFGLTALLAGLVGWLLPHGVEVPAAAVKVAQVDTAQKSKMTQHKASMVPSGFYSPNLEVNSPALKPALPARNSQAANLHSGLAGTKSNSLSLKSGLANLSLALANEKTRTRKLGLALALRDAESRRRNNQLPPTQEQNVPASASAVATEATTEPPQPLADAAVTSLPASAPDSLPTTLRPLVALERQTLGQLPSTATLAAGPLEAESRTGFIGTLRRERAELLRLQRRTDSLLLALGDILPGAPAVAARPDSTQPTTDSKQPATNRWSVLLTATPEQNTLTLQGPENDNLTALRRNHETGRAGFSAAALAEYKLTPRLGVGGGVGYTTFGADLRVTNKTTDVNVTYNTTTTTNTAVYTAVNQTHSIRIIQVPQLSPRFNGSGQVIGYDTVYVARQDTVYSTTIQHDTVRTTNRVTTPTITKKETLTSKLLQPNYRFFTVPVLLRYRLAAPGTSRLWTDVALGAQLQFFLGGTQVVTDDGENFRTEKITAGNGPFRTLNVALSGSLALNYALTNRLSVSVAPSMRWQALSLYKSETGLIQQPTATGLMFGVRFGL
ncbi:hypothetical protein [Hymenobacter rubidus]|uniref:hypothetical protein n=1 Tax=Hymenobacter rubidus TaxID=1441626 RepID=UPI00191CA65E|nr:hypothetical protein [Hymenobacter rubidus]